MMIAPNITRGQRKRTATQKRAKQIRQVAQITINAALWQIIKQNAETPDGDAVLTIPKAELEGVPALFNLQVNQDEDGNILIKAGVKEEKRIIRLGDQQ